MKINAQHFKAAASYASKDKTRPVLNAVQVTTDKAGYVVAATDSYRLVAFEKGTVTDKASYVMIEASHASEVKTSDKTIEVTKLDMDKKEAAVSITSKDGAVRKVTWAVIEGKYPAWKQLIPSVDTDKPFPAFDLNPAYLASVGDVVVKGFGKGKAESVMLWCEGALKPMYFEATVKNDGKCYGVVMPVRSERVEKKAAPKKEQAATIAHVDDKGKVTVVAETKKVDLTKPKAPAKPKAEAPKKAAPKAEAPKEQPKPKADKPKKQPKAKGTCVKEFNGKTFDGVEFTQKREGASVWAVGKTSAHKEALKDMGFKWSRKRQAYFYKPAAA